MNLQENIRKILREETILPLYIRRRVSMEELDDLVLDVKDLIDSNYDKTDAIYDTVRQFVATKKEFKFKDETERGYWDSYIEVEEPLVNYVKTNLHESKKRILREETKLPNYIKRRYICMDEYITKLENGEETLPIRMGQLDWTHYQIIITAFIRSNCDSGNRYYDPIIHSKIMDTFGDRLYELYNDNIDI